MSIFRKRIREQELVFFNSKLAFQFLGKIDIRSHGLYAKFIVWCEGFNPVADDWSVIDKSSEVIIPERTHIKVDLTKGENKSSRLSESVKKPSSTAPKRKLDPAQYLADKRRKKAEQLAREEAAAASNDLMVEPKAGENGKVSYGFLIACELVMKGIYVELEKGGRSARKDVLL